MREAYYKSASTGPLFLGSGDIMVGYR